MDATGGLGEVRSRYAPAASTPRAVRRRRSRRPPALVGLDIGSSAVKVAKLRRSGKACSVAALGVEPLPRGAVVDGAVADRDAVAGAIRKLFTDHAIRATRVAVSLAGNAVIVKRVTLPEMRPDELGESIYWEAKQCVPFDVEDVHLDYQVLAPPADGAGDRTRDVLIVAAKKDRVAEYADVVFRADRVPVVVDVDAFAVQNAYERSCGASRGGLVALLNAGAAAINLNVLDGGCPVFTRDVAIGGNAYTEALQTGLGLEFEDAERLKAGAPAGGLTYGDAEPIVRAVTDRLVMEVGKTLDFFRTAGGAGELRALVLSGGASRTDGLAAALAGDLGVEVAPLDPFREMTAGEGVSGEQLAALAPVAAVAVGLALRRADDR